MIVNGVNSSVLYQNIEMGYTASSATVLTLIKTAEKYESALKLIRLELKTHDFGTHEAAEEFVLNTINRCLGGQS